MVENEHNLDGAIFIAYQGVGKSKTAEENDGFIDLESSNFKDENGKRHKDWYKTYVNIAFDLATQGYRVFVSSQEEVRNQIAELKDKYQKIRVYTIYPHISLRNEWIERLRNRYKKNSTEKNKIAWLNAKENFSKNIRELEDFSESNNIIEIIIDEMDYNLYDYIMFFE